LFQRNLANQYARLCSSVFLLLLVSACVTAPQTLQIQDNPPQNIEPRVELEQVPFFQQRDYQCGPAALATLLNFYGINQQPDDLTHRVYLPGRKGSLQIEMIATARSFGLLTYPLEARLSSIIEEIAAGNPVLVFQNLWFKYWPQWHYAVAVGYDLQKQKLILRSGTQERKTLSFETFERSWQRADHWAYVLVLPGDIPASANPHDYIKACHDLQHNIPLDQALPAYRQAAMQWPDNSLALMALGNAEYAAKDFQAAATAYQQELRNRPRNADAWNNLAYTLASLQCTNQALEAINCALKIDPKNANFMQSLQEIEHMPISTGERCMEIYCAAE
jgi:tetratricopeptide (TPR) repeat protein